MQETPSQNPLQEKLHYYFVGEGFIRLMSELEIDPKNLKPGQTVHQAQQEKIHEFVQEILKKIEPEWDWKSGKSLLLHFDLPKNPAELEGQILNIILALENSAHTLTQAYNELPIKDYDQTLVKNYNDTAAKVRRNILEKIQEKQKTGGTYEVDTLLGEGGIGEVYDTKGLYEKRLKIGSREVVAKFAKENAINPMAQNNPEFIEATQSEPHLVSYYGSLKKPNQNKKEGWGSMVDFLEYVEGKPLQDLLREEGYEDYDEIFANFVLPVTHAVEALHKAGFAHLDIKPGNIMIRKNGDVKLGDYDLVARIGTRMGGESGTPGFKSPEQKGARIITEKSDVYALGKLLAYIVTDYTEGHPLTKIEEPALRQLILDCAKIKQELRPTLQEFQTRLIEYLEGEGFEFETEERDR